MGEGERTHYNPEQFLFVLDPQLTILSVLELARKDLGFPLLGDKPNMQGADSSETVAKVGRGRVTFLLHLWVNEPSLLEHKRSIDTVLSHSPSLPMKLELLPLYSHRQISSRTLEESITDFPKTQQEGPSRLVPDTPVLAHVEINIKVHTIKWHVAFDEFDIGLSQFLDEGGVVYDRADSPDDFPLVRCVWDVADLDFHEVEEEREREAKSVAGDIFEWSRL